MNRLFLPSVVALLLLAITVSAQKIDTIKINSNSLNSSLLKPSRDQYAVYSYGPTGSIFSLRIWTREISFEIKGGKKLLIIKGSSNGADTIGVVSSYSQVYADNFKPIFHKITSKKLGNSGYNFYDGKITGADTVANNSKKDFSLDVNPLPFNWDLDMEMVRTLPLAANRQFVINWYQPGAKNKPEYYLHKVTGSAILETVNNQKVDCWILQLIYSKDSYGNFFIAKKTRELIKVEQYRSDKIVRYKLLLAATGN